MTLTKADIVFQLTNHLGFTKKQASDTTETLLEIIKSTLASGEDVLVSGFGKFCVKQKAERRGRNPATGGDMMLAPRRVVTFRCSGKLRERVSWEGK
jgi:integration host factor subunit alpha